MRSLPRTTAVQAACCVSSNDKVQAASISNKHGAGDIYATLTTRHPSAEPVVITVKVEYGAEELPSPENNTLTLPSPKGEGIQFPLLWERAEVRASTAPTHLTHPYENVICITIKCKLMWIAFFLRGGNKTYRC